jgi:hypothetical protein
MRAVREMVDAVYRSGSRRILATPPSVIDNVYKRD